MGRLLSTCALAATLILGAAPAAHAVTVVGASRVHITSANPIPSDAYLQIAEVIAIEAGTGVNVARSTNGGTATAFDADFGTTPGRAIDGIFPGDHPDLYHSSNSASAFLDVTFTGARTLSSLTIHGRFGCCSQRDVYNVSIFNASNTELFSGVLDASRTHVATVTFDAPSAVVPEPSAWAVMIGGFGAAGAMLRRRRSVVTPA